MLYLQWAVAEHPLASPLMWRVDGFPATVISFGSTEVLVEDSLRFHAKLMAAGVKSERGVG